MIEGAIPPLPTPLLADGEFDEAGLRAIVEYDAASGCGGVVVLGTTGEFPYFTLEEKQRILSATIDQANGRMRVIAGISAFSVKEATMLGKIAYDLGADYAISALPTYFPLEESEIKGYYLNLGQRIEIPLFLYHIPPIASTPFISPQVVLDLAAEGAIVGMKDSTEDWVNHAKPIHDNAPAGFCLLAGNENLVFAALEDGVILPGMVCGGAGFAPVPYVSYHENLRVNRFDEAGEFLPSIKKIMSIFDIPIQCLPAVIKDAFRLVGFNITTTVRSPLPPLLPAHAKKVQQVLDEVLDEGLVKRYS
jgi:4-hydroxy-tetrahydrodipicolinate synthase